MYQVFSKVFSYDLLNALIIKQITYFCEVKLLPIKLRALIKSHGYTVKSFGNKLGITSGGVYDILKRKYLKPDLIEKICKVLTVGPEEFIEYEFPKNIKEKLYAQENSNPSDSEQIIAQLKEIISEKQKTIDAQERIIKWLEHIVNKPRKSIAQAVKSKN